jgi:RNA polymerase sigma-70 factor (ECF subfamily)
MDLLQRFAAGDPDAFEALFRERQYEVYRWIVRIVRDPAAAEDLTVETFWRLYQAKVRLDPRGNCGGWLRRVATNLAIDHLRRARPLEPLPVDPPDRAQPDSAALQEERAAIRAALAELSPRLRIVVRLGLIEDEPYASIAESLGISAGAVKLRMFRALRILRKKLEQRGVKP